MADVPVPVFDEKVLERFRLIDPTGERGVLKRVIHLWQTACAQELDNVRVALARLDRGGVAAAAHRLRGSTHMLGGSAMGQALRDLELAAGHETEATMRDRLAIVETERTRLQAAFAGLGEGDHEVVRAAP